MRCALTVRDRRPSDLQIEQYPHDFEQYPHTSWVWRSPLLPCDRAIRSTNAGVGQTDVGASRPIGTSAAIPVAPISETVYVPIRRSVAPPTETATQELPRTPNLDLVRQLQHELTRVGCYEGDINGTWTPSTRRAMEALIERLNAKLPTARPEPVHLALA
jgi:hypothetical protein